MSEPCVGKGTYQGVPTELLLFSLSSYCLILERKNVHELHLTEVRSDCFVVPGKKLGQQITSTKDPVKVDYV